jgi:alkylated DNA repair dioxygenase AlkB
LKMRVSHYRNQKRNCVIFETMCEKMCEKKRKREDLFELEDLLCENESKLSVGKYPDEELLKRCVEEIWELLVEKPEIVLYGKTVKQPRDVGFFSDESVGYKYSRKVMTSQKIPENLKELLRKVNEELKTEYNGILVNRYKEGDYINAHSDDEKGVSKEAGVISISYYPEASTAKKRIFRVREKKSKKILDMSTEHCGMLIMSGRFQEFYTHEIPKEKDTGIRVSFTFRKNKT